MYKGLKFVLSSAIKKSCYVLSVHDDYTTKDKEISVYQFFMELLNVIPHLNTCYDILPVQAYERVNVNKFKLMITLYHGKLMDSNNPFGELESSDSKNSYKGFAENRSVTT